MSETLLSIIIPSYNRVSSIGKTLDSVYRQMAKQVEVIVVDDGSSDDTENFIAKYYPKVNYLYQENKGVCAARNYGATVAKGRFLYFLDSDDEMLDYSIETFLHINTSNYLIELIKMNIEIHDQKGLIRIISPSNILWPPTITGAFIILKSTFRKLGGYDEKIYYGENSDLFICLREIDKDNKVITIRADKGGVKYLKEDNVKRAARYQEKKYTSLKYMVRKHDKFFKSNINHLTNFYSILAVNAFKINRKSDAFRFLIKIIMHNPRHIKSYARLGIYLFKSILMRFR